MKNITSRSLLILAGLGILAAFTMFVRTSDLFAATIVSSNITTDGTLTVGSNGTFNLGGTERLLISTPSGSNATLTTGVVDLDINAAADTVVGQDMAFTIQGAYNAFAYKTTLTSGGSGFNPEGSGIADLIYLAGNAANASGSSLTGVLIGSASTTTHSGDYVGMEIRFATNNNLGMVALSNTGTTKGIIVTINKSVDNSGAVVGMDLDVLNATGVSNTITGIDLNMDASANSGGTVYGILINDASTNSGRLDAGIIIRATTGDSITTAVDVSDSEISNAMAVGGNPILFSKTTPSSVTYKVGLHDGTTKFLISDSAEGGDNNFVTIDDNGTSSYITFNGRTQTSKGGDVASASTLTVGNDGNYFHITGTTTINYITTTNWQKGSVIILKFNGSVTVTHNAGSVPASTAAILLSGAANFSATADDTLMLVFDGTTWREVARTVI